MSEEPNSDSEPDFVVLAGGDPINETNPANLNYLSETVYHKNAPLNEALLNRLERQKHKYWHFKFINDSDLNEFKKRIMKLDPTITVEHNYEGQRHADIVIRKNGNIVGKLHFLHVNRPDICERKKFYVKVHYYYFTDKELMSKIKETVQAFFDNMEETTVLQQPTYQGGKKTRKRNMKCSTKRNTKRSTKCSTKCSTKRNQRRHKN